MNIKNLMTFKDSEDNYLPNDPKIPDNVCSDCGRTDCDQTQYPCESCGFPHCSNYEDCDDLINYEEEEENDEFDIKIDDEGDIILNKHIFVQSWDDIDKDPVPSTPTPNSDPDDDDDDDALSSFILDDDEENTSPGPISWDDLNKEAEKKKETSTEGKMLSDLESLIARNKNKLPGEPCTRCKRPCQSCGGETFCGPCEVELEKQ